MPQTCASPRTASASGLALPLGTWPFLRGPAQTAGLCGSPARSHNRCHFGEFALPSRSSLGGSLPEGRLTPLPHPSCFRPGSSHNMRQPAPACGALLTSPRGATGAHSRVSGHSASAGRAVPRPDPKHGLSRATRSRQGLDPWPSSIALFHANLSSSLAGALGRLLSSAWPWAQPSQLRREGLLCGDMGPVILGLTDSQGEGRPAPRPSPAWEGRPPLVAWEVLLQRCGGRPSVMAGRGWSRSTRSTHPGQQGPEQPCSSPCSSLPPPVPPPPPPSLPPLLLPPPHSSLCSSPCSLMSPFIKANCVPVSEPQIAH